VGLHAPLLNTATHRRGARGLGTVLLWAYTAVDCVRTKRWLACRPAPSRALGSIDIQIANSSNPQPAPLGLGLKAAYGAGSAAYGIKDNGFNYFLLLYYSQVLGLDAALVGVAITTALVLDAISDPVIGYWSDNLRSRWGRRHPFMYAAALPISLSFFMLWNPPESLTDTGLFWYLLLFAVLIRTFITAYETPSAALAPELTEDYDERSSLISFRYYFAWTGGNCMTVLMFFFVFPAMVTVSVADGRFNRDSYEIFGIVASALIFLSIMVSSLGTHRRIPHLKQPPPERALSPRKVFAEFRETLSERSFLALFGAALCGAVATGFAASLTFYILTFFWEFSSFETGTITLGTFVAALIGLFLAPLVTRRLGKKRGAIVVGLIAFIGSPMPMALKLLGWLPDDDTFVFYFVLITGIVDVGLIICYQILVASMMADLVELSELKTGRRSEGVFSAALTFVRKSVQGLGLLLASLVLSLADFPAGANVAEVPTAAAERLAMFYIPTILVIWMTMMAVISRYRLDRGTHEANLRALQSARAERAAAEPAG
jgi:Na+/melibiose symporter-like transporter